MSLIETSASLLISANRVQSAATVIHPLAPIHAGT